MYILSPVIFELQTDLYAVCLAFVLLWGRGGDGSAHDGSTECIFWL